MTTEFLERKIIALFLRCCAFVALFLCIAAVFSSVALGGSYSLLHSFEETSGSVPFGALTRNGSTLYGLVSYGGLYDKGAIFSINTDGTGFQNLHSFDGANGAAPYDSLTLSGSTLYGMTSGHGGQSTIFSYDTNGDGFKKLFTLDSHTGRYPFGGLTLDGSTMYGMTQNWGGNFSDGSGTVFSINTDGSGHKTLNTFYPGNPYGDSPQGSLTLNGSTLYGMAKWGSENHKGTIFSIKTDGSGIHKMHAFNGADGEGYSCGSLLLNGSTLYGMINGGGLYGKGTIFSIDTDDTGFFNLFSFDGTNGSAPYGSLILSGSTLYGMTSKGGLYDKGTIFSINTDGTGFQNLFSFDGPNGDHPEGSLILIDSTLYGMTASGGSNGQGVIFALSVPEPSTFLLVMVGAIGLLFYRWRRRKRQ